MTTKLRWFKTGDGYQDATGMYRISRESGREMSWKLTFSRPHGFTSWHWFDTLKETKAFAERCSL